MSTTTGTSSNMAALEALLSDAHDEYPAVAQAMHEAVLIYRSRHAVHAGINLQLQGALTSLAMGRPDDACEFIERALDIQARWYGATGANTDIAQV